MRAETVVHGWNRANTQRPARRARVAKPRKTRAEVKALSLIPSPPLWTERPTADFPAPGTHSLLQIGRRYELIGKTIISLGAAAEFLILPQLISNGDIQPGLLQSLVLGATIGFGRWRKNPYVKFVAGLSLAPGLPVLVPAYLLPLASFAPAIIGKITGKGERQ
ncbi:hypothetical protein ACFL5U_01775 [Candidatus Margulisiibacteriota bacterium]